MCLMECTTYFLGLVVEPSTPTPFSRFHPVSSKRSSTAAVCERCLGLKANDRPVLACSVTSFEYVVHFHGYVPNARVESRRRRLQPAVMWQDTEPLRKPSQSSTWLNQSLPLHHVSNFLKGCGNVPTGEVNLAQAVDVAELLAALFQYDDCPTEPKSALKQSSLMYDVHPFPRQLDRSRSYGG